MPVSSGLGQQRRTQIRVTYTRPQVRYATVRTESWNRHRLSSASSPYTESSFSEDGDSPLPRNWGVTYITATPHSRRRLRTPTWPRTSNEHGPADPRPSTAVPRPAESQNARTRIRTRPPTPHHRVTHGHALSSQDLSPTTYTPAPMLSRQTTQSETRDARHSPAVDSPTMLSLPILRPYPERIASGLMRDRYPMTQRMTLRGQLYTEASGNLVISLVDDTDRWYNQSFAGIPFRIDDDEWILSALPSRERMLHIAFDLYLVHDIDTSGQEWILFNPRLIMAGIETVKASMMESRIARWLYGPICFDSDDYQRRIWDRKNLLHAYGRAS